jgi:phosphatidylserine/phosphatidylglycerophosphate/cardiolipin synthase-like enzyme
MNNFTAHDIAIQLVKDIPGEYVRRVTDLLSKENGFDASRILHRLQSAIPQIDFQEKISVFVDDWNRVKNIPSPGEMALIISAVDAALKHQSEEQSLELTWTGPKTDKINLRRTEQALIELIRFAKTKVVVVSFAVYKARNIMSALEQAAKRGVEINIIVESPEISEGKIAYDTIARLGISLKSMAKIFIWPQAKRDITPDGKYGALHAKIAASDNQLYISSANLTDYGMNLNMEMGILLTGGELPEQVRCHFDELIENGVLAQIPGQ